MVTWPARAGPAFGGKFRFPDRAAAPSASYAVTLGKSA